MRRVLLVLVVLAVANVAALVGTGRARFRNLDKLDVRIVAVVDGPFTENERKQWRANNDPAFVNSFCRLFEVKVRRDADCLRVVPTFRFAGPENPLRRIQVTVECVDSSGVIASTATSSTDNRIFAKKRWYSGGAIVAGSANSPLVRIPLDPEKLKRIERVRVTLADVK